MGDGPGDKKSSEDLVDIGGLLPSSSRRSLPLVLSAFFIKVRSSFRNVGIQSTVGWFGARKTYLW